MCVSSVQSQTLFIFARDLILALVAVYHCGIKGKGSSSQKGYPSHHILLNAVCKMRVFLFVCFYSESPQFCLVGLGNL